MGHHDHEVNTGSGDSDGELVIQPMSTPFGGPATWSLGWELNVELGLALAAAGDPDVCKWRGSRYRLEGTYSCRRAATSLPLPLLGLGGVGVLEIVGAATKLICPATIWPVAVLGKVLHWCNKTVEDCQYGIAGSPLAWIWLLPGNWRRLLEATERRMLFRKIKMNISERRNNFLLFSSIDLVMWHW